MGLLVALLTIFRNHFNKPLSPFITQSYETVGGDDWIRDDHNIFLCDKVGSVRETRRLVATKEFTYSEV